VNIFQLLFKAFQSLYVPSNNESTSFSKCFPKCIKVNETSKIKSYEKAQELARIMLNVTTHFIFSF